MLFNNNMKLQKNNAEFYGYDGKIDHWRNKEFGRLRQETYLDHVGATLYSESQIENHMNDLKEHIYGNPHSANTSSQFSSDLIEEARHIVAKHFNTTLNSHHIIFTSGATTALKLVADNFKWSKDSSFLFLEDSHTSVVGIRENAKFAGSRVICVEERELLETFQHESYGMENVSCHEENCTSNRMQAADKNAIGKEIELTNNGGIEVMNLFSYPAMSNFCGRKYPLSWVQYVKSGKFLTKRFNTTKETQKWFVLLDAASYVGTNALDLSKIHADFVAISFYKMFGFPTGLGALIIRADAVDAFGPKMYYGGGTVASTISKIDHHVCKAGVIERFEDGTASFLSIIALKHGFNALKTLTGSMTSIKNHTFTLAQYTYKEMKSLKHENGLHLCQIYTDTNFEDSNTQGPIINFNLMNADGDFIGYSQVEKLANLSKLHLRTGCFCNTGDCQKHLGLMTNEMLSNFEAGHVCGDQMDIINSKPTGSVRISFGYMSTLQDSLKFLDFLRDCFLVTSKTGVLKSEILPELVTSRVLFGQQKQQYVKLIANDCETMVMNNLTLVTDAENVCHKRETDYSNLDVENVSLILQERLKNNTEGENIVSSDDEFFDCLTSLHTNGDKTTQLKNSYIADIELDTKSKSEMGSSSSANDSSLLHALNNSCNEMKSNFSDSNLNEISTCSLDHIYVYPVKSCAAFEVSKWFLGRKGLLYDREWMIVNEHGSVLTQKKEPRLVFIKPYIDINEGHLILRCDGHDDVTVPLSYDVSLTLQAIDHENCLSKICGDRVTCDDCGEVIANWLNAVLGRPCRLVRQNTDETRIMKTKNKYCLNQDSSSLLQHQLSLSNESQFLLISKASLFELFAGCSKSKNVSALDDLTASFRGNFVVNGNVSFEEDNWREIKIGDVTFTVIGGCQRCQMICVNQNTAERDRGALETLIRMRGSRMEFGIYLVAKSNKDVEQCAIETGDKVIVLK